ncbi:MAG: AbrB family transcriptional regulator [Anaerolineaceae bacterium]|nr:MAG: AbrB family transcriptional regulator [Anaerolineaceae bacterium]
MNDITVSPKFQVVIPLKVREALNVRPGQKMRVLAYNNQVILIPVRPIKEARGSLKGIETDIQREEDRV